MPGGGGIGRPLGPSGGRGDGGGGTGRPDGLWGGRAGRCCCSAGAGRCCSGGAGRDRSAEGGRCCSGGAGAAGGAGGAAVSAALAAGTCCVGVPFGGPSGARGGALAGRLVIRRGAGVVGAPTVPGADAATLRTGAGAFLAGLELVTAPALEAATDLLATPAPAAVPAARAVSDLAGALAAGAGSSGWTGRRSPSASALRRTRSACASSMEEEWLFTPIPRDSASSRPSLLVRPSSLASS